MNFGFYIVFPFSYNICIMAYGQTGSGKTHTMLGSHKNEDYHLRAEPHKEEGVIPRAARELFRSVFDNYTLSNYKNQNI